MSTIEEQAFAFEASCEKLSGCRSLQTRGCSDISGKADEIKTYKRFRPQLQK